MHHTTRLAEYEQCLSDTLGHLLRVKRERLTTQALSRDHDNVAVAGFFLGLPEVTTTCFEALLRMTVTRPRAVLLTLEEVIKQRPKARQYALSVFLSLCTDEVEAIRRPAIWHLAKWPAVRAGVRDDAPRKESAILLFILAFAQKALLLLKNAAPPVRQKLADPEDDKKASIHADMDVETVDPEVPGSSSEPPSQSPSGQQLNSDAAMDVDRAEDEDAADEDDAERQVVLPVSKTVYVSGVWNEASVLQYTTLFLEVCLLRPDMLHRYVAKSFL